MASTTSTSVMHSLSPVLISALVVATATIICIPVEGKIDAAALAIPALAIMCAVAITFAARTDPFLFKMMLAGLVVKLLASWIYTSLPAFENSDIKGIYFDSAKQLAGSVSHLTDVFPLRTLWGTNLIIAIGACIFSVLGSSLAAAMVLFAIASFWGQFFFYRACILAFPGTNKRVAAGFMFLFPSLVYWTSAFGKDALMMLATGLISYGIARRFDSKGCAMILIGLPFATLVRPHIGAFIVVSLFASYLLGDIRAHRRIVGAKILLFPLFVAISVVVLIYAKNSLELASFEDAQAKSDYSYKYNQVAGSAFGENESTLKKLILSPLLLFRPFPWEINNWTAALASGEGLLLLLFVLRRRAAIRLLVWRARAFPLTIFTISLFIIFSVAVSLSISNFGLLARQRVMILPSVLILIVASRSRTQPFSASPAISLAKTANR